MPLAKGSSQAVVSADELAYIAGLFDGEGCVTFARCRKWHYVTSLVTNTDRDILEYLQGLFGGNISRLSLRKPGWKQGWSWRLTGSEAVEFLAAIQPWLKIKDRQATVAFAWNAVRPGPGRGPIDEDSLVLLRKQLAWLNTKGGTCEPEPLLEYLPDDYLAQEAAEEAAEAA